MTLQELVKKIELEAQEGRIGVSKRIEFFDKGTKIGIKRSEIDKLIDGALNKAKQASQKKEAPDEIKVAPVPKMEEYTASIAETEVPKMVNELVIESLDEPESVGFSEPTPVVEQPKIEESITVPETEEFESFFQENEEIEYDDFLFEDNAEPLEKEIAAEDRDEDFSIHNKEQTKQKLENILNTIKAERKTETSFKEHVGEDPSKKIKDPIGTYIEKQQVEGAMLILIAGIASIVIGGFGFVGAISGMFGLGYVASSERKVKEIGPEKFTDASLSQLRMGKILCYVGLGLAGLKIIGKF